MTRIYVAPFHASLATQKADDNVNEWPYDNGDDPSFYAMRQFGGRLTWGVCRQDVRNAIKVYDIVIFFSFQKDENTRESKYRLCGLATVEQKVSQVELWEEKQFKIYQNYSNLLIRPSNNRSWEHFEPALPNSQAHNDWLWRCVKHTHLKKTQFDKIHKMNKIEYGVEIAGCPISFAKNYILFSQDPTKTYILSNPPIVARYSISEQYEKWEQDEFSQEIKRLILKKAEIVTKKKRWLRINNNLRPHRHIVFELSEKEAESWRNNILQLIIKKYS